MVSNQKFISLHEIEGIAGTHHKFMQEEIGRRKEALQYITEVSGFAEFLGGTIEHLGVGEDWAIKKELFPGVEIIFLYYHADAEFPSDLRILYSGYNVREVRGEDLVALTIACVNHMLRYVREKSRGTIPQICYRV